MSFLKARVPSLFSLRMLQMKKSHAENHRSLAGVPWFALRMAAPMRKVSQRPAWQPDAAANILLKDQRPRIWLTPDGPPCFPRVVNILQRAVVDQMVSASVGDPASPAPAAAT